MNIFYRKGKFCHKLTPYFTSNNRYLKRQYFFKILILHCYDWHFTTFLSLLFRMATFFIHLRRACDLYLRHKLTNPNLAITEAYKYIKGVILWIFILIITFQSSMPSQNRPFLLSSDQRYSRVVYVFATRFWNLIDKEPSMWMRYH